jgi:tetratricopeptide (TPR) repeat protein
VPAPSLAPGELEARVAPRLVVLNTELAGTEYRCTKPETSIGRGEENDLALEHLSLSRAHAKVHRDADGNYRIEDLESVNGVSVNGHRSSSTALRVGDELELGQLRLRFAGPNDFVALPTRVDEKAFPPEAKKRSGRGVKLGLGLMGVIVAGLGLAVWQVPELRERVVGAPPLPMPTTPPPGLVTSAPTEPAPTPSVPEGVPSIDAPPEEGLSASLAAPPSSPDEALVYATERIEAGDIAAADRALESVVEPTEVQAKALAEAKEKLEAERKLIASMLDAERSLLAGKFGPAQELLISARGRAKTPAYRRLYSHYGNAMASKRSELLETGDREYERGRSQQHSSKTSVDPARTRQAAADSFRKAKAAYQHCVELDARFLNCHRGLGNALIQLEQYDEALKAFQQCLALDPNLPACHFGIGGAYARLQQFEKGAEHYSRFIALAPPSDPLRAGVQKALDEYEKEKANRNKTADKQP